MKFIHKHEKNEKITDVNAKMCIERNEQDVYAKISISQKAASSYEYERSLCTHN